MIKARLLAETRLAVETSGEGLSYHLKEKSEEDGLLILASHAALECYQSEPPELRKTIDIENRLFKTGHHTTLEHHQFTFNVEGIAVSDITFGVHLCAPFYNSDQRSGRFCAKMFTNPDFNLIREYIEVFWPELKGRRRHGRDKRIEVIDFIKTGVEIYQRNIDEATKLAAELISEERPYASADYIRVNAPKIAQEQLRVFISTIFPTGFDFTVDLIMLASLYSAAWTPGLVELTRQMASIVTEHHPEIAYVFSRRGKTWAPIKDGLSVGKIMTKPQFVLLRLDEEDDTIPDIRDTFPVDLLHFLPEYMGNNINGIETTVEISVSCMGQDQRHRTIGRGSPTFTGNFYLPPVPALLPDGLRLANVILENWRWLTKMLPPTLATAITPYGAMVNYKKRGSLNAVFHEQGKRLCWCAQEEIYHLSRYLRRSIESGSMHGDSPLLKALEPPCFTIGKCVEGARYCGRDISLRESGDYFPERKV